jgi:glycine C-acetyltransferase
MSVDLDRVIAAELDGLREAGTYKRFNTIESPQGPVVEMAGRGEILVLSSNNYLGLAAHPEVIEAGIEGLRRYGAGTASVRFICGTFEPHEELERELASLSGTEAALTYVSCWNANEALVPTLTDESTVILSDELNHASLIDAMRLARPARKVIYKHSSMDELRDGLRACERGQRKLVITDGVFSMEGDLARLPEILELAHEHEAVVVVDDSHGTGVMGKTGRGVAEHFGVLGEVDMITSTLGKALGGAAGGYVAASEEVCDLLAQRSRPQLFSNALPPTVACSALEAVRVLRREPELVERLHGISASFRARLRDAGFSPLEGEGAIIPIIVGETSFAIRISERLLDEGIFVTGFGYPVVPEGTARIRVQMSAALEDEHLDRALEAFERVGRELGLLRPR